MLKKTVYLLCILFLGIFILWGINSGSLKSFINTMENSTFDLRQKFISNLGVRKPSKDIVIIAIDDASYEYILDKYGEWPLRRDLYAKMVDYIEAQSPKSIAFDLMFVKSIKSDEKADQALINIFKKYDNVYTAMNLDNQPEDLRTPVQLPDSLSILPFPIKNEPLEYFNCRTILKEIIDSTDNIGLINVSRSDDGVLREMPLYLKYQDKYIPQLAYRVAVNDAKNIKYDDNANVILNWYGPAGTFTNIPMYKLLKASLQEGELDYNFKDKIVYFGATAASLFDIKTVPVDKVFPGVEVQTTYVNNLIDGSLIDKCPNFVNIIFGIILTLLTIIFVLKISSMPIAFVVSVMIYALYVMFTYYMMRYHNMWVGIVLPVIFGIISFIGTVIFKYIMKSRDFDYQYKLATTDGLTELYNHRHFQEQMNIHCANSARYNTIFSLIILDIDFFKKFNDNFGHQSGDAVLRQVALTLKKNVRATDIVCRYGGEEMSIILPNTNFEEGVNIAEKLRTIIAQKTFHLTGNRESNVTISLGVATYGKTDGLNSQDLISSADKRLYNAKENGRNKVN